MCEPTSQEPDFFNHLGHMNDLRKYKPRKRQPSNREELPDFEGNESDVIILSEEEIQEELQSLVEDMNLKKTSDKDYIMEVTDCIEDIDTFFFTHPTSRKNIGDYLAELNFAEIVLNVMRKLTDEEMKLESFWDQYYFAYISCYHYSLNSTKFAKSLIDNDILQLLTSNLTRKDFLENIESEQSVVFILEISLQIINKLARSTHLKNTFEIIQISEAIKHLLAINKEETLNFVAELTLIYIGETPDQPENFIKQLLSTLQMALDDTNCRAEKGFYPWELIHCLSRLSSLNLITGDLIQVDLLNNLKRMILDNVNEEQRAAAECLWHLGFDNSILKKIQHEDDLNNALKSIANSEDSLVKENAQGALWIIQEKYKNVPETHQTGENSDMVFLSFHDDDKKPVQTLCSELKSMGYTVIQDHTRIDESDFF
uniref:TIR domain-containing protein n=1 Tax=Biomphalaria glabrata TaxID=6526 RepID=A0A2C9KI79_BIOGL